MSLANRLAPLKPLGYRATSLAQRARAAIGLAPPRPPVGIVIERSACLDERGVRYRFGKSMRFANLLGEQAVFLLRR